jgi:hypothetical protein
MSPPSSGWKESVFFRIVLQWLIPINVVTREMSSGTLCGVAPCSFLDDIYHRYRREEIPEGSALRPCNIVSSSLFLSTLMMEAIRSSNKLHTASHPTTRHSLLLRFFVVFLSSSSKLPI